jgi:hypothetical protein
MEVLDSNGRFAVSPTSRAFPGLSPADLYPFIALRAQMDENAIVRQFRTGVRQRFAPGGGAPPSP